MKIGNNLIEINFEAIEKKLKQSVNKKWIPLFEEIIAIFYLAGIITISTIINFNSSLNVENKLEINTITAIIILIAGLIVFEKRKYFPQEYELLKKLRLYFVFYYFCLNKTYSIIEIKKNITALNSFIYKIRFRYFFIDKYRLYFTSGFSLLFILLDVNTNMIIFKKFVRYFYSIQVTLPVKIYFYIYTITLIIIIYSTYFIFHNSFFIKKIAFIFIELLELIGKLIILILILVLILFLIWNLSQNICGFIFLTLTTFFLIAIVQTYCNKIENKIKESVSILNK